MIGAADFLASFLQIALDHNTFDKVMNFRGKAAAVQYFLNNTNLFFVLFVGIGVVGINDDSRVLQIAFIILFKQKLQIFVMIVGNGVSVFVDSTSKNGVSQRVSGSLHFPVPVNKVLFYLCSYHGVQHNGEISTGRILHAGRDIHTADYQTVLLILNRAGSNGHIGENIVQISPVFRIKHLIGSRKSGRLYRMHMHFTKRDQSMQKIRFFLGIRLMKNSLIAFSGCTRFVGIDPGNQNQFICNFFLHTCKTFNIFTDRFFIICGTWTDNNNKFVGFSGENFTDHSIPLSFYSCNFLSDRIICLDFSRCRQSF